MNIPDYHIHTLFSDGSDWHMPYIEKAIEKGFTEIGFSDHVSIIPAFWATDPAKLIIMQQKVKKMAAMMENRIAIRFGIEMDYYPGYEKEIEKWINKLEPDYVIGSVHFIGSWNFDNEAEKEKHDSLFLYQTYYKYIKAAAQSGLFDFIGHFDLVKKFNPKRPVEADELEMSALESIAGAGIGIELNTNGKNKPCSDFYPSSDLLSNAYNLGIPVTLGSDAHSPLNLGQYFDQAVEVLRNIGYESVLTYNNRNVSEKRFE